MTTKDTDPKGTGPKDDDLDKDAGVQAVIDARQGLETEDITDMFYYTPQKPNMDEVYSSMKFSGLKPEDIAEGERQGYQDYLCKVAADPSADPAAGKPADAPEQNPEQDPKADA